MSADDVTMDARRALRRLAERAMGLDEAWIRQDRADAAPALQRSDEPAGAPAPDRGQATPKAAAPAARSVSAAALFAAMEAAAPKPPPAPADGAADDEISGAPLPRARRIELLRAMDEAEVRPCVKCALHATRSRTVFGEGDPEAPILFIGEGPGETEDQTGRPFVGRAGELLDRMIASMGLKREQVFIANIVKCRPPGNREPAPDEVGACSGYLRRQVEIVRPPVIVTLGKPAAQHLLQTKQAISKLRGTWHWRWGIPVMPTFHPAYLLRAYTQENRAAVWSDLQQVMERLGLPRAARGA